MFSTTGLFLAAILQTIGPADGAPISLDEQIEICEQIVAAGHSAKLAAALRDLAHARDARGEHQQACVDRGKCAMIAQDVDDPGLARSCLQEFHSCASNNSEFQPQAHLLTAAIERQFDGDLAAARAALDVVAGMCEVGCRDSVYWQLLKERLTLAMIVGDPAGIGAVLRLEGRRGPVPVTPVYSRTTANACEWMPDETVMAELSHTSFTIDRAQACVTMDLLGPEPCGWDPRPSLEQARRSYPRGPDFRWNHQNITIIQAWAAELRGDDSGAIKLLTHLGGALTDPELLLWYHGLRLRLAARGSGPWQWRRELARLKSASGAGGRTGFGDDPIPLTTLPRRWLAALWIGQALRTRGQPHEAIAAFEQAERWIDQMKISIELGATREQAYAVLDVSKRALADLYYECGMFELILELVVRSQARVTTTFDATGRSLDHAAIVASLAHRRSEAAVARAVCPDTVPPAGHLELAFVRSERGWIGIAVDAKRIDAAQFVGEDFGSAATFRFDAQIEAADVIHVLQDGSLQHKRVDDFWWRGARLWESRDVRYAVVGTAPAVTQEDDVCSAYFGARLDSSGPGRSAVAALEQRLSMAWPYARCPFTPAAMSAEVEVADVVAGLGSSDFALLYGHFRYTDTARSGDPWSGSLQFGRGSLGVRDLFDLARVPAWTVLMACSSASTHGAAPSPLGGAAQVLVGRGARGVVATSDAVAVDVGAEIMVELARALAANDAFDLPRAFSDARSALLRCITPTPGEPSMAACSELLNAHEPEALRRELAKFIVIVPALPRLP